MGEPSTLQLLMGGGVGLLVLKEAISFIKWGFVKVNERRNGNNGNSVDKLIFSNLGARFERVETKLDRIVETQAEVASKISAMQTSLSYLSSDHAAFKGSVNTLERKTEALNKLYQDRLLECERRFSKLEARRRKKD